MTTSYITSLALPKFFPTLIFWWSIRKLLQYWLYLKGALSRILTDFQTAKMYICGVGNLKIMFIFINNCYIRALKLLTSIFSCWWLGWKWIATLKIMLFWSKRHKKKKNIYSLSLISICKVRLFLPWCFSWVKLPTTNFWTVWTKNLQNPCNIAPLRKISLLSLKRAIIRP